jgi:SulP family sulfate permease
MAGIILFLAGIFRAGKLIALVPEAVVNGFTIGIGIIIATSQLKDFFGLTIAELPANFLDEVPTLWDARGTANLSAFGIAILTLVLIVLLRRLAPRLPGLIVAVGFGSFLVVALDMPVDTLIARYGELPNQLPWPTVPVFSISKIIELLPSAFIIAFLAGVESLLSAMVADKMIEGHHRPNAELTAQGVANVGSALMTGLPATGAIARTATNIRAGGKTPIAGIVHALVILLVMLLAAPVASHLAMPALAALLVITAWNMTEPHKWVDYARGTKTDFALLLLTLSLTVLMDLTVGIGVGVCVGLALKVYKAKSSENDWTPPQR